MRMNKLLVTSLLALPAVVAPMSLTTSCSNAWGHKSPISIGSIQKTDRNNPYFNYATNTSLLDIDGQPIANYLPSNYILDSSTSTYYSYSTPIAKWTKTENNVTTKLPTGQWEVGTSNWYTSSPGFTTSATCTVESEGKKYNITEACAQNVTLTANTSFVTSIAQFINKYVNYAINYAASQVKNDQDFAVSWGGTTPADSSSKNLREWMYANANSISTTESEAYLKSTQANFNFENMPIVSYNTDKSISSATKKLLTGDENSELGDNATTIYWSEKTENGKDDDKYTVYTYPSVPVLVRTTNLTQRWVNPKTSGSIFVTDYYQNDKAKVQQAFENSNWPKEIGENGKPSIREYEIKTPDYAESKDVKVGDTNVDQRIKGLSPKGTDFIAFVTYSYVEWAKPNPTLNRNNTVTLSSLQTIMPAYFFDIKADMFKKIKTDKDNSGYMVDVTKADNYSTELINLLSRSSDQGRVSKASDLNDDSKNYLKFLYYMFAKTDSFVFGDFVTPIDFNVD